MSEMIERVANALYEDQCRKHSDSRDAKAQFYKDGVYHDAARIAIAAMREPTEAMVTAALTADGTNMMLAIGYDEAWRAMIDAALAETGPAK